MGSRTSPSDLRLPVIALAITAIALASTATTALGASTRAEYIAQVDPICQAADQDISRMLRGFNRNIRRGELPTAGRKYARATRRFKRSIDEVAAVPPPPADVALITQWLGLERRDASLPIAQALKRRQAGRVAKLFKRSFRLEDRIDALIGDYGFIECN